MLSFFFHQTAIFAQTSQIKSAHISFKPNLLATYFFLSFFPTQTPILSSLVQNHFVSYFLSIFSRSLLFSVDASSSNYRFILCVYTFRFLSADDRPRNLCAYLLQWLFSLLRWHCEDKEHCSKLFGTCGAIIQTILHSPKASPLLFRWPFIFV